MAAKVAFALMMTLCLFAPLPARSVPGLTPQQQGTPAVGPDLQAPRRAEVIRQLGQLLEAQYVFPEKGTEMKALVDKKLREGAYDRLEKAADFARVLTADLRSVTKDLHLRVVHNPDQVKAIRAASSLSREERDRQRKANQERERLSNFGFRRLEILDGGIGYLDLLGFSGTREAGETAVAAMNFLAHCPAIIIDLRQNGGGDPFTIQIISSYFLGQSTHLNSFEWRGTEGLRQFWSLPFVPGRQLAETDLYILTSRRTFSAAEEFTYNMKNLKRATLVGETTGGGAHPGGFSIIDDGFLVWIPRGRAVNPITRTNWEGTGIEPHVALPSEQALDKAHQLALEKLIGKTEDSRRKAELEWVRNELEARTNPFSVPIETLQACAGFYEPVRIILENGALYAMMDTKVRLIPIKETMFVAQGAGIHVEFVRGDKGEVVEAIAHFRNGRQERHKRTKDPGTAVP